MSDDNQEYYFSGEWVKIWGEVKDRDDMVIVSSGTDYGEKYVVRRSELRKKEDTYEYQQAVKRKEEIEKITEDAKKNLDKLADKLVDKALIALASRMKFNAFFGKGGSGDAAWAVMVIKELEDLVKDKAANTLAGKKDSVF